MSWDCSAATFVGEPPGSQICDDPSRLDIFKDYVRNIAEWLHPSARARAGDEGLAHAAVS